MPVKDSGDSHHTIHIPIGFRWPVTQTGLDSVEVVVPTGTGSPILDPRFCEHFHLTDSEVEKCEHKVIRLIAIVED